MTLNRLLLLTLIFFAMAVISGLATMYLTTRPAKLGGKAELTQDSSRFMIEISPQAGLRLNYDLKCQGGPDFEVSLRFYDELGNRLGEVVSASGEEHVKGEFVMDLPPATATIDLVRGGRASCRWSLSYQTMDVGLRILLLIPQIILSLVAISLAAVWFMKKVHEEFGQEKDRKTKGRKD